jgi:large subunit ribosomal protein L6
MSRIGKRPVVLPKGVTVTTNNGTFEVKGPKGSIKKAFPASLTLEVKDGVANLGIKGDVMTEEANRFHGTTRALINSAVVGVTDGFKKNLKLEGTGYKAELKGQMLNLTLGLSHPVNYELPKSVSAKIPPESKGTVIQLESFDKEALGQTVANLQSFRPPEPYKGKGVQVEGQKIRRKAGKAGGKGGK